MDERELEQVTSPDAYLPQVLAHKAGRRRMHHGTMESVREADYRGHHIVVRTSYEIEVDGRRITGHLAVRNDGRVHYHPVPNLAFASAVELVERLIDVFPDEFPPPEDG